MVYLNSGEDFFMTNTTPWIAVHDVNKLEIVLAVTDYSPWHAFRNRNEFAIDNEHTVIEPLNHRFNDARSGMLFRKAKGHLDLFSIGNIEAHTATMVAIEGFNDDGVSHTLGSLNGTGRVSTSSCLGTGSPKSARIL